jgi:K+ transporter
LENATAFVTTCWVAGLSNASPFSKFEHSVEGGSEVQVRPIAAVLARNADDASSYFHLPTDRVVEIGTQVSV